MNASQIINDNRSEIRNNFVDLDEIHKIVISFVDTLTCYKLQKSPMISLHASDFVSRFIFAVNKKIMGKRLGIRNGPVFISGAKNSLNFSNSVEADLKNYIETLEYSDFSDVFHRAAWAHWRMTCIHPFWDGNGRTARAVQDFILLSHGYPVIGRRQKADRRYYSLLEKADEGSISELREDVHRLCTDQSGVSATPYDPNLTRRTVLYSPRATCTRT